MYSRLYAGLVSHRRYTPVDHAFRYAVFMVYIDLDELPDLFKGRWLWSVSRPALARFKREDHLGNKSVDLKTSVRDFVKQETGIQLTGPIRLLTNLRYFGIGFNPVSFYYCFSDDTGSVEVIVAEVNNTPWGQQFCYALPASESLAGERNQRFLLDKRFHVSPFMSMDIDYDWRFTMPDKKLIVHMQNHRNGERLFDATLSLQSRPISPGNLAGVLLRYPLMTTKIVAAIYFQALRLLLKKIPFYSHPDKLEAPDPVKRP